MRINWRSSGGRGEYEISDTYRSIGPAKLNGYKLVLKLDQGLTIDTGTKLKIQGGKPRLRRMTGTKIQLHLQLAAALLMPHPVREAVNLGGGAPVLQRNRYMIDQIDLSKVKLEVGNVAIMTVKEIYSRNNTYLADELRFTDRMTSVRRIWENTAKFPEPLSSYLSKHRDIIQTGGPVPEQAQKLVYNLGAEIAQAAIDLGVAYSPHTDVLPPLIQFLDSIEPTPPINIDEIDPAEVEIKLRTVREWRQWASHRGAASFRFRRDVREAYSAICLVCGLHLPTSPYNKTPGVDAAHILPWAEYDLDQVSNGLCLCKLHHWAFDEGLLIISFEAGKYSISIPETITQGLAGSGFSLDALQSFIGEIPTSRLPADLAKRPSPQFLKLLREKLD